MAKKKKVVKSTKKKQPQKVKANKTKEKKKESKRQFLKKIMIADDVEEAKEDRTREYEGRFKYKLSDNVKETVSYLEFQNSGLFCSAYKLDVVHGTNSYLSTDALIDILPLSTPSDIKTRFIIRDITLTGNVKDEILVNNARSQASGAMVEHQEYSNDILTMNKAKRSEIIIDNMQDYMELYDAASPIPLLMSSWTLLVFSTSKERIDQFIEDKNEFYDINFPGLSWRTIPTSQKDLFESAYQSLYADVNKKSISSKTASQITGGKHNTIENKNEIYQTNTPDRYSKLLPIFSRGLRDQNGEKIGRDVVSPTGEPTEISFTDTIKKSAIIASSSRLETYEMKSDKSKHPKMASMIAQAAANNFTAHGRRVYHLVLNGYDYRDVNSTMNIFKNDKRFFEFFDTKNLRINVMEGRGEYEEIVEAYARLKTKLLNVFDIMYDFKLDTGSRAMLADAIDVFYRNKGWYRDDAQDNPQTTRIIKIPNSETYETISSLLSSFTNSMTRYNDVDAVKDRLITLSSFLKSELTQNAGSIGSLTRMPELNALQTYFDFSKLNASSKAIQFLNVSEYVLEQAYENNGIVVIHGIDRLRKEVAGMMTNIVTYAEKFDIPVIYVFDKISETKVGNAEFMGVKSLQGVTFDKSMSQDTDLVVLGKMTKMQIDEMEVLMDSKFSLSTKSLMTKSDAYTLFSRRSTGTNSVVFTSPIV